MNYLSAEKISFAASNGPLSMPVSFRKEVEFLVGLATVQMSLSGEKTFSSFYCAEIRFLRMSQGFSVCKHL